MNYHTTPYEKMLSEAQAAFTNNLSGNESEKEIETLKQRIAEKFEVEIEDLVN